MEENNGSPRSTPYMSPPLTLSHRRTATPDGREQRSAAAVERSDGSGETHRNGDPPRAAPYISPPLTHDNYSNT